MGGGAPNKRIIKCFILNVRERILNLEIDRKMEDECYRSSTIFDPETRFTVSKNTVEPA